MKHISQNKISDLIISEFQFSADEILLFSSAIGEILEAWNYEKPLESKGYDKELFQGLSVKLDKIYSDFKHNNRGISLVICEFSEDELKTIRFALYEVLELWDWEYSIRTGFSQEEFIQCFKDFNSELKGTQY